MSRISDSYHTLRIAIDSGANIAVDNEGNWYERDWITSLVRRILGWEKSDHLQAATKICKNIQKLSVTSQTLDNQGLNASSAPEGFFNSLKNYIGANSRQRQKLDRCREVKQNIKNSSMSMWSDLGIDQNLDRVIATNSAEIKFLKKKLAPVIAIEAEIDRCMHADKNLTKNLSAIPTNANISDTIKKDAEWLEKKVKKYFQRQEIQQLRPEDEQNLKIKIERAACYPEFMASLKNNWILRDAFCKWLRASPHGSKDAVDTFIQAPYIQTLMSKSFLDKRVQRIANDGLRFIQKEGRRKEVQLLIHGQYQSISYLDGIVKTGDATTRTVKSLFQQFQSVKEQNIDLEFLETGIEEGDFQLKKFDFTQEKWWEKLPVIEIQSKEAVQKRFPNEKIDGTQPLLVLHSTTKNPKVLAPLDTHSFIDIYIPQGDGTFNVISPGKYADSYVPSFKEKGFSLFTIVDRIKNLVDNFRFAFSSRQGTYVLADSNNYMTHRHHKEVCLPPLSKDQFETTMQFVKEQFINAREGRMLFQMQGNNCATTIEELLKRLDPNLNFSPYRAHILETKPPAVLQWITESRKFFMNETHWNNFRLFASRIFGAGDPYRYTDEEGLTQEASLMNDSRWVKANVAMPNGIFREGQARRVQEHFRNLFQQNA